MAKKSGVIVWCETWCMLALLMGILIVGSPFDAMASFTIKVAEKDRASGQITGYLTDFKWVVQEDNTHPNYDGPGGTAGVYNNFDALSVSIHKSHAKVLASGTGANPVVNLPPTGRYFVSINAPGHYSISGGMVKPGDTQVTLIANPFPVQLAQITVLVFQDNMPINGAPDIPNEPPLGGFRIYLYDQLGQQSQDAFGNPIGTTYNSDANGNPILDAGGNATVKSVGPGYVLSKNDYIDTNFNYNAVVPNLAPGKYGIWVQPADGRPWMQVSTIEGTPGIDNWVLAGEPNYFTEVGFFGVHSFLGFVLPAGYVNNNGTPAPCGDVVLGNTDCQSLVPKFRTLATGETAGEIDGQVVQNRINRPPLQLGLNPGDPVPTAIIGLSDVNNGNAAVFALQCNGVPDPVTGSVCDANAKFSIKNVPPGTYTLSMWDLPLDQIIDFRTITVPATGGQINAEGCPSTDAAFPYCPSPIYQWFGNLEGSVLSGSLSNGKLVPTTSGLSNQLVNLRFRDGSIFQSSVTDPDGNYSFSEFFPFFKWLVVENDATFYKPVGATVYVDKGGPFIPSGSSALAIPSNTPGKDVPLLEKRTDTGNVVTEAIIQYMDNTGRIDWYKQPYAANEAGYIFGMVSYAFTRAPVDPSLAAQAPWEPGVPDVEMKLYRVDSSVTDSQYLNGYDRISGKPLLVKDTDGNPKVIATTHTDSWDKNFPTGCLDSMRSAGIDINAGGIPLDKYIDCSETMPIWNQIKPGVFDGTYVFEKDSEGNALPAGDYVVEAVPPTGYEIQKEEDTNFILSGPGGSDLTPSVPQPASLTSRPATFQQFLAFRNHKVQGTSSAKPAVSPPRCVGPDHIVPAFYDYDGVTPIPTAGQTTPLCTMKVVQLPLGQNVGADFRIFTPVELAGRIIGLVTDDLTLEFRQGNPRLGDKLGPSFMPVSIDDFNGNELLRSYTDEWGQYNMLVPSTFWTNTPNPTGVSPHIINIVLNRQFKPDGTKDRFYKPGYPTATFPMDVWPGKITYADTPIVPIRPAIDSTPIDCNYSDGTPVIAELNSTDDGPIVLAPVDQKVLTITSAGLQQVLNPDQSVPNSTILKDYSFGKSGSVYATPKGADFGSPSTIKLKVLSWSSTTITASPVDSTTAAPLAAGMYQIMVARDDNLKTTQTGISLHVAPTSTIRRVVPGGSHAIQDVIDAAGNGDLVLVPPGTYLENLIMWKPVKLQGYGPGVTLINAGNFTPPAQAAFTTIFAAVTANPNFIVDAQQPDYFLEQGAAVMVFAPSTASDPGVPGHSLTVQPFDSGANQALIDGFALTGANNGGGINVNAYAHYLQITNNKIYSNNGTFGGGIRIGVPTAQATNSVTKPLAGGGTVAAVPVYASALNDNMLISNNEITFNGGTGFNIGSGGGIGLFTGSDSYRVTDNLICGNYAQLGGAGITHQGVSNNGLIQNNKILFNESFDEGAGIFLAGEVPLATVPAPFDGVSEGVGNVMINANLIQGNKAGNLGGGIALLRCNGQDVSANPDNTQGAFSWYRTSIDNNMIVNNLSAGYGGGIAISDALDVKITNNTVSYNDSTATGELAFGNVPFNGADVGFSLPNTAITKPLPAGIATQAVSGLLIAKISTAPATAPLRQQSDYQNPANGNPVWSVNPEMYNDVIFGNKSYFWNGFDPATNAGIATLTEAGIWDLGVFGDPGTPADLAPRFLVAHNSLLTGASQIGGQNGPGLILRYDPSINGNQQADPSFVSGYRNSISATQGGAALGNFVAFTYTPVTLTGNYHITGTSPARGAGVKTWLSPSNLDLDIDGDTRVDIDQGADNYNAKGDLDGNGIVDLTDVVIAMRLMVGTEPQSSVTATMLGNVHVAPLSVTGRPAGGTAHYDLTTVPPTNDVSLADVLLILKRAIGLITW
ncbi:hypothetical protein AOG2_11320 [Geobacter sp. AOG2]|nr:hypothetical protein AOG2_11320 [Geobacter sp. AOG2]